MADFIGQERVICHGSMVEGTQVPLKKGGSTLEFKSKNLGYYALKCLGERMYILCRYKSFNKFSSGKEPLSTYTFVGTMKVHRIIMGQGNTKYFDTVLIVIHDGYPFYFKPLSQKVKRWREAFMFVASVLQTRKPGGSNRSSSESDGPSSPERHCSPSHSLDDKRKSFQTTSYSADDQEDVTPSHLLPDVIDVGGDADFADKGAPDEEYEKPREVRPTRKSIYRKGKGGNYVTVEVNIDEEPGKSKPEADVAEENPHRVLSRQRSRSNEDVSSLRFDQLHVGTGYPAKTPSATLGPGFMQHRMQRPGINMPRTQSAAVIGSRFSPRSHQIRKPRTHLYERIESDSDDGEDAFTSECQHLVSVIESEKERDRVVVELRKDCVSEGLVFVEIDSSIYIATWKKSLALDGRFQENLHIGDCLLQVNDQQAINLAVIQSVIESSSTAMVKLWLRRLPHATVVYLTRNANNPWGFETVKNQITEVYEGAGLSKYIDKSSKTKWIITELNHQPVSIQSCGKDEVKHLITASQTELALVLQPKDFIDKLSKKLQKSSIKKKRMVEYIV
ncbi:uncharacterized protein LOC129272295 [Lytechinus pictus]|uniref:uncharacterized protein LOC129272295 n=1 Tax=Lytechinus pictus TaxID=7653 RepID=UPI0030BA2777